MRDVLIGSQNASCISVASVSAKGWQDYGSNPSSYGYFEKGSLPFNMDNGIILSTGTVYKAPGPNSSRPTANVLDDTDVNWSGDADLANALGVPLSEYLNSTVLEFDFTPSSTSGISFEYMFLSEEYFETNCDYPDAFVFLIKKAGTSDPYTNIALVPGTLEPVTSQSINAAPRCRKNAEYFGTFNNDPYRSHLDSPTAFNGETKVLTATADVIAGETYHIKLVVADRLFGNDRTGRYDSAVFIKAGSFVGKKDLGPDRTIATNNAVCAGTDTTLDATTPGATSYQWLKDGSPLAGEISPTLTVPGLSINAGNYEVEILLSGCRLKGSVRIEFSEKPVLLSKKFCNYNGGAPISITLQTLNPEIVTNYQTYFEVKYFADATHSVQLPDSWTYTDDTPVYVLVKSGNCALATETIEFLTPRKSLILDDQTICAGTTGRLEAEDDFSYYKWMRENGEIIAEGAAEYFVDDIPVGKYSVELTSPNGCKLTQQVEVTSSDLPTITHIDVSGSTATVYVSGGLPPYSYSLDGIAFQDSNVFRNIPRGLQKVYVRDAQQCAVLEKEFLVLNLINAITPNSDGQNDVLDYSDLRIKENVVIQIFDRNGTMVFKSENQQFIWDGKLNGRTLPTATYWYVLSWTEPGTGLPVSFRGWILLKNR